MKFFVFTTMKILILVLWVVTPCGLVGVACTNVLVEHTASIFRAEGVNYLCVGGMVG
jgi:hypothetical protein